MASAARVLSPDASVVLISISSLRMPRAISWYCVWPQSGSAARKKTEARMRTSFLHGAGVALYHAIMTSPGRSVLLLIAPMFAIAAGEDAREQLIRQLDQRALEMLQQRTQKIAAIQTRDVAEKRRAEVRAVVLRSINGLPDQRGPLNAKTTGTLERDGFRIEKVTFESLPGFVVTANVYVPAAGSKHPAIVMTPGHG